uniref:Uncharacterized protein n=1 Tax=Sphaerodactylus townsendi TaxID=933632 RepID=A0ACB8FGM6_9SAUR
MLKAERLRGELLPYSRERFYEKILATHQGMGDSVVNPLSAYTLIKRLQVDWLNVVYSAEASQNSQACLPAPWPPSPLLLRPAGCSWHSRTKEAVFSGASALKSSYQKMEKSLPAFEDLEGAARAVMRLQDVYALSVQGLARGKFQKVSGAPLLDIYSPGQDFSLSADDCFSIGKVAYDMEDHYHSIAWLEEAVSLFRVSYGSWNTEDEGSLEDALDHLAFSYFKVSRAVGLPALGSSFLGTTSGQSPGRASSTLLCFSLNARK